MLTSLDSGVVIIPPENVDFPTENTVCITGHREKHITPYQSRPEFLRLTVIAVRLMLAKYIDMAAEKGYTRFISGLATGTDTWAAIHVIKMKSAGQPVELIGAMPFLRHSSALTPAQHEELSKIERCCKQLYCTAPDPASSYDRAGGQNIYRTRNFFMVDHASVVVGFYEPRISRSGTAQTVNYANRRGRTVRTFGLGDVFRIMDTTGPDIDLIARHIRELDNVFDMPF